VEGEFRSRTIFLKEAIGGFGESAEEAADHLRDGGLHVGGAGEVDCAGVDGVGAADLDGGAGDGVGELGEGDNAVGKLKVAEHGGANAVSVSRFDFFWVSQATQAELADAVLNFLAGEGGLVDEERSVEGEALFNGFCSGRNVEARFGGDIAGENGWAGVAGEAQEVFDTGAIDVDFEVDVFALAEWNGSRGRGAGVSSRGERG